MFLTGASVALCVSVLTLAVPSTLGAQALTADPDRGIDGVGFVDYVGNYGEVLKLPGGWKIDASMSGEMEVISHYPSSRISFSDSNEQFHPKPTDFVPENFSRYALMQLVIMPRAVAPIKSLEELKRRKVQDLAASGVGFRVIARPVFGGVTGEWPRGTFEVWISTPYHLTQLYAASDAYLCILTSGQDEPPSTVIGDHYEWMRLGLRDWLVPPTGESASLAPRFMTPAEIKANGLSFRIFRKPLLWMGWALASGIALFLAGLLGLRPGWERMRRAGLLFLLFSHAGAAIGLLVGFAVWAFSWPSQHLPFASALACLLMPFLALFMGRFRSGGMPRRALIGVAAWVIIASGALSYSSLAMVWGPDFTPVVPGNTAIASFLLFGIGGVISALLNG